MIPLFTSIPPALTRKSSDGMEIGDQYLRSCIQSWVDNGFSPISINSVNEAFNETALEMGVSLEQLPIDASTQFNKPLVYFADFISTICTRYDGVVAITNSDIIVDLDSETHRRIINLKPGECVISKRCDIHSASDRAGRTYDLGYDFFAFHTDDLKNYSSPGLVFGQPWWDHHLAAYMLLLGVNQKCIREPIAYHLKHSERWDNKNWLSIGKRFVEQIDMLDMNEAISPERLFSYRRVLSQKKLKYSWINTVKSVVRPTFKNSAEVVCLQAVSSANLTWIGSGAN
jgi:hypothetical protein